jgi:hypothetical protein
MNQKNLEEIFKKAAEISKSVPSNLQEVAFNRALDALLNESCSKNKNQSDLNNNIDNKKKIKHKKSFSERTPKDIEYLLENLDRTKYQEIFDAPNILTSSLFLLKVIKDDYNIDGLGPTDIAKLLTEKFRIRTTRQAVTQALDAAGNKVDKVIKRNRPYYRIMHNGEKYLENKEFETDAKVETKKNNKSKPKNKTKRGYKSTTTTSIKTNSGSKNKVGPKKIITDLISEGFFDKAKKIKDIQEHIAQKMGYNFNVTTLSPTLTRLLREGKLTREKSSDGQYEYTKK